MNEKLLNESVCCRSIAAEREFAIQQIVSRTVASTEIVDIMEATGLENADIDPPDDFPNRPP